MSTQIDLGTVLSIPKGDWNASTTYERLNLVRHNSAAWICNVDTSTGVEPSEDSVDWFLQVKDTSAVSSVNGMKGDVEITTIQTPSNDSNDTSIANTEWVCDRIDETINSTHSYTDNAISVATTSILNTAAQDASNKATVAVNQALAASETKFVTKEVANNLTNDVNILIENDATQDEVIASKFDKSGGTVTGIIKTKTVINASVLPPVVNQYGTDGEVLSSDGKALAKKMMILRNDGSAAYRISLLNADGTDLPYHFDLQRKADNTLEMLVDTKPVLTSAGGTMTGPIYADNTVIYGLNNKGRLGIASSEGKAAMLNLFGRYSAGDYAGAAELVAENDTNRATLALFPDGNAWIKGNSIITSAGGTMTGSIEFNTANGGGYLYNSNDTFYIGGRGTDGRDSAFIRFFGLNSVENPGSLQVCTRLQDGNWGPSLFLRRDGYIWWNNNTVLTLVASWTDGVSGYRKYNDGYIEQWGRQRGGTVTFPIPFSSTDYCVTMGTIRNERSSNNESAGQLTTTSFYLYTAADTPTCWFAAGY